MEQEFKDIKKAKLERRRQRAAEGAGASTSRSKLLKKEVSLQPKAAGKVHGATRVPKRSRTT